MTESSYRSVVQSLAIAVLLIGAVLIGSTVVRVFLFPGEPFDAAVWRDPAARQSSVRYPMGVRMVSEGSLKGKSRTEVLALLGTPEYSTDGTSGTGGAEMGYYLCPAPGFISGTIWYLVERLGPDDRVTDALIKR